MKIPTDANDIPTIRAFLTEVRTQVCSLADYLSDPWKKHFTDLKEQYDSALKGLPPTDQVPAAMEANKHLSAFFSCLANANSLVSMLGTQLNTLMKEMDTKVATALNSKLPGEIEALCTKGDLIKKTALDALVNAAIAERVKAGELVEKATHTQLCSAAKELGATEGENRVKQQQEAAAATAKTITKRKEHLQTCGLPLPEAKLESMLAGTDEQFTAAQQKVKDRMQILQKDGIALNSKSTLLGKLWAADDDFETFRALAKEALGGGDLLVTRTPTGGAADPKNLGPMCV